MKPWRRLRKAMMRRIVALTLISAFPIALMASQMSEVQVAVRDATGKPIQDCYVALLNRDPIAAVRIERTDQKGRTNQSVRPDDLMMIRCVGFISRRITPIPTPSVNIQMESSIGQFPSCTVEDLRTCASNFGSLCFPEARKMRIKTIQDADYYGRLYCTGKGRRESCIGHFEGETWSYGFPIGNLILDSEQISEMMYLKDGAYVAVAHGKANGESWRFVGKLGETVTYEYVIDDVTKAEFDAILDRICIKSSDKSISR